MGDTGVGSGPKRLSGIKASCGLLLSLGRALYTKSTTTLLLTSTQCSIERKVARFLPYPKAQTREAEAVLGWQARAQLTIVRLRDHSLSGAGRERSTFHERLIHVEIYLM